MSDIAYYGSCPSEEFVKYAFPESRIAFFCYGVNVASFMGSRKTTIRVIEDWPEPIKKKLHFEARKGFCDRLKKAAPTTLVIDFSRVTRASLMRYAAEVWAETAAHFHAAGGFEGLPRSSDLVSILTNYSSLMDAFTRTAASRPDLRRFSLDILHGALPYLFAKISSPAHSHFGDPVDSHDVVAAFRWILGREPESALTFLNHYALPNRKELRDTLLRSFEFQSQVPYYAD
ncbi:hypothetical protein JTP94_20215 [Rhizobium lusitanum]|nr:hypothetical protein [Rhizobium lusitanum]